MTTATWALQRLLAFLNQARQPSDISLLIQDDPATGKGYGIGEKVAAQLIAHRQQLPLRRFSSEADVLAVAGLGKDKLHDLLYSFSKPANEAFVEALRQDILYDNWEVLPQTRRFESQQSMTATIGHLDGLRQAVGQLAAPFYVGENAALQNAFRLRCRQAYLASYPESHLASFHFAHWWYLFDQDNWFSFERIRLACENHLNYHAQYQSITYVQLNLYHESPLNEIGRPQIIPATINYPEQSLTVWWAVLND